MLNRRRFLCTTAAVAASCALGAAVHEGVAARAAPSREVALSDLDIQLFRQRWDHPQRNRRSADSALMIGKRKFESGVGTVADSVFRVNLKGSASKFSAWVGPDAIGGPNACVRFYVVVDGNIVVETSALKGGSPPVRKGFNILHLMAITAGKTAAGCWSR